MGSDQLSGERRAFVDRNGFLYLRAVTPNDGAPWPDAATAN